MILELQSVLLIIGIIAIVAILLHGLLTIRGSNKPIDVSEVNLEDEQELDRDGFDCHGVGVARVIKTNTDDELNTTPDAQLSSNVDQQSLETQSSQIQTTAIDFNVALESEQTDTSPSLHNAEISIDDEQTAPMFASPIAKEKEDYLATKIHDNVDTNVNESPDLTADNALDNDMLVSEEVIEQTVEEPPKSNEIMDVLVLNIIGEDGGDLDGATLLPVLLTLGFKFGEMNIFHRHVDAAGQGPVIFSLANMVQPGHFDIDNMEQFSTQGVSLFMTIPHRQGNMETFNTMLNASAKIAEEFNGQVLDGDRNTLTNQSTQKYVQRIRKLERDLQTL